MELWESYKQSIFLCHQRLAEHVCFAIISAQNPAGQLSNPVANLLLDKQLQAHLDAINTPYRSITGAAPDFSFQEKSWMVLCEKQDAIEIGQRFNQNAIYWVEHNKLYLVPVLLAQPEECLGVFNSRMVILPS
ncbi:DUF3293 domain-containing protein [Alishewanella sp. d11]|uniref:DUF3293 domain-containing protein n=1 Tax=Alishewanella sp. d11 TaxID=3414030 RepID=UPI003BF880D4